MRHYNKVIFELSEPGRTGYSLPECFVDSYSLDPSIRRTSSLDLPEVTENAVVRHYVNLSSLNVAIDKVFYPLGSCTMKYNPKINDEMASLPGFARLHPLAGEAHSQGSLALMYHLERSLAEVTGMAQMTLNPFAGAHGELVGLMIMKAYHEHHGQTQRTKVIVPTSAHGTNPASAQVAGYDVVEVGSNADGTVDIDALRALMGNDIAGIMLTNPNTIGIFEKDIAVMADMIHEAGGLLYYDGANLNAMLGVSRPGDMGFDIIHLNLHKTFSTPHGGGGPGAGPVGVCQKLTKFLPVPEIVHNKGTYHIKYDNPLTIGQIGGFYGNFGILVRAYTYILSMGRDGLRDISRMAVLNANYVKHQLKDVYDLAIEQHCKHEVVFAGLKHKGIAGTLDVAKAILDMGFHAPTIYFPLVVKDAIMIEPTESESKQTLDEFVIAMKEIARLAVEDPGYLKQAPYHTPVRRVDEVLAARQLVLTYQNKSNV
jgi:glycine dehydrogenase subunit 2